LVRDQNSQRFVCFRCNIKTRTLKGEGCGTRREAFKGQAMGARDLLVSRNLPEERLKQQAD
jgi:hypothetical protein